MQMKPSFYLTVAAAGIVFNVKLGLFECAQVTYQHILQVGDYINYTTWRNLQSKIWFIYNIRNNNFTNVIIRTEDERERIINLDIIYSYMRHVHVMLLLVLFYFM